MFDIDPDRPNIPGIAQILSILGMLCLIGSIAGMLLAFSRFAWVSEAYAIAGAGAAFLVGCHHDRAGQDHRTPGGGQRAGEIALRHRARDDPVAQAAAAAAPKPTPVTTAPKDRVITIPEEVARQQGLTRRPREPE